MADLKDIQNRRVYPKGVKRTQTVRVRIKGPDGGEATINVKNFNEDLHEKLPDKKASTQGLAQKTSADLEAEQVKIASRKAEQAVKATPFTRAELVDMAVEALKMTPEWDKIPAGKRSNLKDKEAIIDAIIKARQVSGR